MSRTAEQYKILARGVRITNSNRVLFPGQGITKAGLIDYYTRMEDLITPHVAGRALAIVRCPEGQGKPCFFQKHRKEGLPPTIHGAEDRSTPYLWIDDLGGLIGLVQIGALEIHGWGSMVETIEKPDRLVFDLDPGPGVEWDRVISAAKMMIQVLEEFELRGFVRTTGGKGLHVVVPIRPSLDWATVRRFCMGLALAIVKVAPSQFTANMRKSRREGKIFIDYLRNARGATSIVTYSPRARPGAPISIPVALRELKSTLNPLAYTVLTAASPGNRRRFERAWKEFYPVRQILTRAAIERVAHEDE